MKKLLLLISLLALSKVACAQITLEDLTRHSWMSDVKTSESCEIPPLISFTSDMKLSGEPGCNNLVGEFFIGEKDQFTFPHLGLTKRLCAKAYMQQESQFMAMLEQTAYAKKQDGKIHLLDQNKRPLGVLVPEKASACQ